MFPGSLANTRKKLIMTYFSFFFRPTHKTSQSGTTDSKFPADDEPHQGDGECGMKGRPNQGLRHKCIEAIQGVQPSEAAPVNKAVSIGLGLCAQDD